MEFFQPSPPTTAALPPTPIGRVLVVDDNATTARLIALQLGHHGISSCCAADGRSALEIARCERPDLVLLDANLPDMDGSEVCRAIKTDPCLGGVLVAFLSAERTAVRDRIQGLDTGADAYLTHPIDEAELLATVRSLLRLRQAELGARESRDLYRELFDSAPVGIAQLGLDGVVVAANRALASLLGAGCEQLAGRLFDVFLHPDERPMLRAAFTEVASGRRDPGRREVRLLTAHGTSVWVALTARLHRQTDGAPARVTVALEDITARKQAEAALRERDDLLHELYEVSHDLIATISPDGCILEANTAFHRALGLEPGRLRQAPLEAHLSPVNRAAWHEALDRVAGGAGDELFRGTLIAADRSRVHVEGSIARRDLHAGVAIRVIFHDATELRRLEEQALRNQRLDSLGTLAGGIAHDLNNVLAPVFLSVELIRQARTDGERAELVDSIERSARRASDLVRQVLLFARGSSSEKAIVEPIMLLRDLAGMLRQTFPKNIELDCDTSDPALLQAGALHANATQITQVLLNLCLNSRDAMPDGGQLRIHAQPGEISSSDAASHPGAVAGPAVVFTVADSGRGIPPEAQSRIFDPFFTTKEVGKGTGLGLPTALGIVRSHGGCITFDSAPDSGTRFTVRLPAVTVPGSHTPARWDRAPRRGRGELILVVDDEEILRKATETLLRAQGYRVVCAADGHEAVSRASSLVDSLRVVVTDVMMPRLDGFATATMIRRFAPEVPVIAMTGYAGPEVSDRLKAAGIVDLLPKPFEPDDLLHAIETALHAQRPPAPVDDQSAALTPA